MMRLMLINFVNQLLILVFPEYKNKRHIESCIDNFNSIEMSTVNKIIIQNKKKID